MSFENKKRRMRKLMSATAVAAVLSTSIAIAADKPNIVVIFGDDIGQSNISAYTHGLVGYKTPNIDRIAKEGIMFTDYYGEQSSTAGRSTFITGQSVIRTGLSKVGLPGADVGLQEGTVTMARVLKDMGYSTAQFGKNHLGDLDKYLPTNHGFDRFFGNLYHLNAQEEPENADYPKNPEFLKRFGPRGVIKSFARIEKDGDPSSVVVDGSIEDTGPLDTKRMETIDEETLAVSTAYMEEQVKADKPFFLWWNATRMHFRTHVKKEHIGISGQNEYGDGMVEHDMHVGAILDKIDELGIADNTIVIYTTDNGPHSNTWPDAALTPFRGEKTTNWEGGWRVPAMIRYPGKIKPDQISNEIIHHMDWLPTLVSFAGDSNIKQKLLDGVEIAGKTYKNHLDGYDFSKYLTGEEEKAPREEILYFSDDLDLMALRYQDWKVVFQEQRAEGTFKVWAEPFVELRVPKIFNLRRDPYERADITSNTYYDWVLDRAFVFVPAQTYVGNFLSTLKDYPPAQSAASFNLDSVMKNLQEPVSK